MEIATISTIVANEIQRFHNQSGAHSDEHMIDMFISTRRSEATKETYNRAIGRFMDFAKTPLNELTVADFTAYMKMVESEYESPATINNKLAPIRALLSYANKIGYTRFNVGAAVSPKPVPRQVHRKIISEDVLASVIEETTNKTHKIMLYLLYASGGRVSEFINLTWADILFQHGQVVFTDNTKGGIVRKVPVAQKVMKMLAEFKAQVEYSTKANDYVFQCRYRGEYKKYTRTAINQFMKRTSVKLGMRLTPHMLRHSIASHSLANGMTATEVRDRLGHSSLEVTSIYAHDENGRPMKSSLLE